MNTPVVDFEKLAPGQRIRVRQTIDRREGDWHSEVSGTVIEATRKKTGSWYAHGTDNKFWIYRIQLRKDDGEITTLTLDQWTEIELLSGS
ncbi:MAG: hypothetical protein AB7N71_14615 [Phycisphaerae bacterium]